MTRREMKERIQFLCGDDASNRISFGDWSKFNTIIDNGCESFCERTCYVYGMAALTMTIGEPVCDLRDTAVVDKKVVIPMNVYVEGVVKLDVYGDPDLEGFPCLVRYLPSWPTQADARPIRWLWESQKTIRLNPTPDAVYNNCFVEGWQSFDAIGAGDLWATSNTADDVDNIPIAEEDGDTLAAWIGRRIVSPVKRPDVFAGLVTLSDEPMRVLRMRNRSRVNPSAARGEHLTGWRSLGR